MPGKTVRDMGAWEKRQHSLTVKMFRTSVAHLLILSLLCFAIGLSMYMNAAMQETMKQTQQLARRILAQVAFQVHVGDYADRTREIYDSLKGEKEDAAYLAAFDGISGEERYQRMVELLRARRTEDMSDFVFVFADQEKGRLITIADTDPRPGHVDPMGHRMRVPRLFMRWFFGRSKDGFPNTYYYLPKRGVICVSGAYIRKGNPSEGFLLIAIRAKDALWGMRAFTLQYAVAIILAIFVLGYFRIRYMRRTLVEPINRITEAAQVYAMDKRAGVPDARHFSGLNLRTGDELENLSLVMADMERELAEHERRITRITAERERINTELSLANAIQAGMLPHVFPPFPDRAEFDIFASMAPAKEVGGDFYDFYLIDDDHLGIAMADVSGKGVPAALFMMASMIMLKSVAMLGRSPAEILEQANDTICSNNDTQMFITVWLGILEISTGKLTAANAGHEYPAIRRADGRYELYKDRHGFVIGGMEGTRYREYELQLEPGACVFLYTDGLPEATDANGEMFGTQRMLDVLNARPDANPEEVLKELSMAVDEFVMDAEQFDDLTMLCMQYKGGDPK